MNDYLARLREQQAGVLGRMQAIVNTAAAESRDLRRAEERELTQLDSDAASRKAQIKHLEELEARTNAPGGFVATVEPHLKAARESTGSFGVPSFHRSESRMHQEMRDFREILNNAANGQSGVFESRWSDQFLETRALQSAGGSAIPTTLADFVTVYQRTLNPVYGVARVLGRDSGAPISLPRLTADASVGGTVTAEAAAITEADPTISQVTLTPFKVAGITNLSSELWQDETIGLPDLIAEAIARPIALGLGAYYTTGAGGTAPTGFVTTASPGSTALGTASGNPTDTFFSPKDLVDLFYSLAAPYRANATWMVSSTAVSKIAGMRDSTGQFIWRPSFQNGQPDLLLGRPIYENPAMAAVASATKPVAVGDFSRYYIAEVQPLRIEVSKDYKWSTDQVSIRVITRADGVLADAAAVKTMVAANT